MGFSVSKRTAVLVAKETALPRVTLSAHVSRHSPVNERRPSLVLNYFRSSTPAFVFLQNVSAIHHQCLPSDIRSFRRRQKAHRRRHLCGRSRTSHGRVVRRRTLGFR